MNNNYKMVYMLISVDFPSHKQLVEGYSTSYDKLQKSMETKLDTIKERVYTITKGFVSEETYQKLLRYENN